jgi:CRISPR/Cas system CMR subunit Cmr4 (Cas7 group RAMP superfamily)
MAMASDRIKKAWVIKADLKNVSPLIMGDGEGDSDKIIQKNANGQPIINGSAFKGCLKSAFEENIRIANELTDQNSKIHFWGSEMKNHNNAKNEEQSQSHLRIIDIKFKTPDQINISILDGIKIAHDTQIVEDKAKYDYEVINSEAEFEITMEVILREDMSETDFNYQISAVKHLLEKNMVQLGAFTSAGFGKLQCENITIAQFSFPEDAKAWFAYKTGGTLVGNFSAQEIVPLTKDKFRLEASFCLDGAIMTGASTEKPDVYGFDSDKTHYHFNKKPALIGKAIKGSLRHRMLQILNTLGIPDSHKILFELYGWGAKTKSIKENETTEEKALAAMGEESRKSRLKVDFTYIEGTKPMLQDRIKIDRFTQGTVDGAKFDSVPEWSIDKREPQIVLKFEIEKPNELEQFLLLHVLKDLWHSDLAIGGEKNVGRGTLNGIVATLSYKDSKVNFTKEGVTDPNERLWIFKLTNSIQQTYNLSA